MPPPLAAAVRRLLAAAGAFAVIASAACTDELPLASRPEPGAPRHTAFYQPPNWRAHWQSGSELWVYDKTPELALNSHLATYEIIGREVSAAPDLGMRLMRTVLYWKEADPDADEVLDTTNGSYLWTIKEKMRIAREQNVELLMVVHGQWVAGPQSGQILPYYPATDFAGFNARYANFLQKVVDYLPDVKYWQIWNEQDAGDWGEPWRARYNPTWYGMGEGYAKTLRHIYPIFRDHNPRRWMVMGGLTMANPTFVQGMYNEFARVGKPYPLDIMAMHGYGDTPSQGEGPFNKVNSLTAIMAQYGDQNRPIWVTETGTSGAIYYENHGAPSSASVYDTHQAQYYRLLGDNLYSSAVTKVFGYSLYTDNGGEPPAWTTPGDDPANYNLSLLRRGILTQSIPRPAYDSLHARRSVTEAAWNHAPVTGDVAINTFAEVPRDQPFEYAPNDETMYIKGLSVGTLDPTRVPMIIPVVFSVSQQGGTWSGSGWTGHVRGTPENGAVNGFRMVNGELPPDVSVCYTLGFRPATSWEPEACNGAESGGPSETRVLQAITMRVQDPQQRGWSICYQAYIQGAGWTYPEACDGALAGWGGATIQAIRVHVHRN